MPLNDFSIIDTTLREGEQFINAFFSRNDRIEIAGLLDEFGVEFIELPSPYSSPHAKDDYAFMAKMGLKAKLLTHIRCHKEDINLALETGVHGLDIFLGASPLLQKYSINKNIEEIIELASEVLCYARKQAPYSIIRFSTEDSFRSNIKDLLKIFISIEELDVVNRYGIADTVGIATPKQVEFIVRLIRSFSGRDIEFHGHNDTACAVANSHAALEAGATHIDTTVLGIGERNGITSLAGLIARMYTIDPEMIKKKYNLKNFKKLHEIISQKAGIEVPANHYIFGNAAFSHKAGIHTNAILKNPETYEIINPEDFGLHRRISIAHRMTGKKSVINRARELGLEFTDEKINEITMKIKVLGDERCLAEKDMDDLLIKELRNDLINC